MRDLSRIKPQISTGLRKKFAQSGGFWPVVRTTESAGSGSCLALSEQRQLVADIPGKLARLRPFACDGRPAQNHEAKSRKSTQDPLHRNHLMADELHIVEVFPARRMIAIPESQA